MTLKPYSIPLGGVLLAAVFLATPPMIQPLMAADLCRSGSVTCTMSNNNSGHCGVYSGSGGQSDCVCIYESHAEHQSACFLE